MPMWRVEQVWVRWKILGVAATLGMFIMLLGSCASPSDDHEAAVARGAALSKEFGCAGCHSTGEDDGLGPGWGNSWGKQRLLEDGRVVTVDAEYLRRSLTDPAADVVAGFSASMPRFPLSENELEDLVAYLMKVSGGKP